ncbi:uncharacterized protein MYCFIDRAFT_83298 [Pseudocercospora fijiensis CIRAD86]|uniref:Uncharacterized protein n=1 Tax=Pseudocercospora fijiensis (strain CIRAD86) TaxID=383855 RepID=M3AJL8_PSEFD|nr:uncharacterized protein MYCFIDRAFT_83298 [Pseudocercospora fijiensis CIRAD86]EME77363.1 hypothetical protein MYCFIDRAFT_83298 [Pseudocercospora fijiensis CIRAD86]
MASKPQDKANAPRDLDDTPQYKADTLQYVFQVDSNPFWPLINQFLRMPEWDIPEKITAAFNDYENPAVVLAELWEAFFVAVATSGDHRYHLGLLGWLRKQATISSSESWRSESANELSRYPPHDGTLNWSFLPGIVETWQRMDGALLSRRHSFSPQSDRPKDPFSMVAMIRGAEERGTTEYFCFISFSAYCLHETSMNKFPRVSHPVNVLYACKAGLERRVPDDSHQYRLWSIDVLIATEWLRAAGWVLWKVGDAGIRKDHAAALAADTPLWKGGDALTPARWALWAKQLKVADVSMMCMSTRVSIIRAYKEIEMWLRMDTA